VPINIRWDELGYVKMLALAHDGDQRWYYYPDSKSGVCVSVMPRARRNHLHGPDQDMTVDEVLVFKSFQYFKRKHGRLTEGVGGESAQLNGTDSPRPGGPAGAEHLLPHRLRGSDGARCPAVPLCSACTLPDGTVE